MKNKLLLILTVFFSSLLVAQSSDCETSSVICDAPNLDFAAGVTGTAPAGNEYDCLFSQPNPTWFTLNIGEAGDLSMSLTANSDIDFIVYGPFPDSTSASNACGSLGDGGAGMNVIDCSYSGTANEQIFIGGALVGEVYKLLVTNYSNQVQDINLTQNDGSTGGINCPVAVQCVSQPGTFVEKKNGNFDPSDFEIYLCDGDNFLLESNDDFILPQDTVFAPIGDFEGLAGEELTHQLMWLVYEGMPDGNNDPDNDPNYMNLIIPGEDLAGQNSVTDPIFQAIQGLGGTCGTYYFVPVAGDDGIGNNGNVANGINDNGGIDWDKNNNGCFNFGPAYAITFACPINVVPAINCGGADGNAMDLNIAGGFGNYNISNQGVGNLSGSTVVNNGTLIVSNLVNNSAWEVDITDAQGCLANSSGVFVAPTITGVTFVDAADCPAGINGEVNVSVGTSGQAPLTVTMNGVSTVGPNPYSFSGSGGTGVTVLVEDGNGCQFEQFETVPSAGQFIDIDFIDITNERCFGDGIGSAEISATPTPTGTVQSIVWTYDPNNTMVVDGGAANQLTNTNMEPGAWSVTVTDNTGCFVSRGFDIEAANELSLNVSSINHNTCFEDEEGSATLQSNGGEGNVTITWDPSNQAGPDYTDGLSAIINNASAGTYLATGTDQNNCTASVEVVITQPEELILWMTVKPVACYGDTLGGIIVDSTWNNFGEITYTWSTGGQLLPNNGTNLSGNLGIGVYDLTVEDENGCKATSKDTLVQSEQIILTPSIRDSTICRYNLEGQLPDQGYGQLFAIASGGENEDGDGTDFTFVWTENLTGETHNGSTWGGLDPGAYTIQLTNDLGCVITETIQLDSLSPLADFTISSPQFTSDFVGTAPVVVTFQNLSENYGFANHPTYGDNEFVDTLITWTFGLADDPYITEDPSDIIRTYTEEGLYKVCLHIKENLNGCEDSTCIEIQIYDQPNLIVPNVFTPGGGGVNDEFFFPNQAIVEFSCTIYDRWGKEVYQFNNINDKWNGTNSSNDKDCSAGVYFYMYEGVSSNGTEYKGQGNVHLIR